MWRRQKLAPCPAGRGLRPAMNSVMHDPNHRRADEARSVANQMTDAESTRAMLEIAAECDKLAQRAEDRARTLGRNAISAVAAPPARTA
jgi:hypothetical protein